MDEKYIQDLFSQLGGEKKFGKYDDFKYMLNNDSAYRKDFYNSYGENTLGKYDDFDVLVKKKATSAELPSWLQSSTKDAGLLGGLVSGVGKAAKTVEKDPYRDGLPETQEDIDRINKENEALQYFSSDAYKQDPVKEINRFLTGKGITNEKRIQSLGEMGGIKKPIPPNLNKEKEGIDFDKITSYAANDVMQKVRKEMFPTAQAARDWKFSNEKKGITSPDNETDLVAEGVLKDHEDIKSLLEKTQGDYKAAAVLHYGMKDPQTAAILKEGGALPEETAERLLSNFLNDQLVFEASDNQFLREKYFEEKGNFRLRNPLQWANEIVSKIAQGREDYGYNNPFINLTGMKSSDEVVSKLYEDGKLDKQDLQHYDEVVREQLSLGIKKLPTPGLIENTIQSFKKGVTDIPIGVYEATGVKNLVTTPGERAFDSLVEQENQVSYNPKGWANQISHATGNLTGVILPISPVSKALKFTKLIKNPTTANQIGMSMVFYHDLYNEAERKDPKGGLLNQLQAVLQSAVYAKVSPVLGKMSESIIKSATPEIRTILKNLQTEAITGAQATKQTTNIIINKITSVAGHSLSASNHMALAGMTNDVISGVFTGKYDFDESVQTAAKTWKHLLMGTPLLNIISVSRNAKPTVSKILYEMTNDPVKSRGVIEKLMKEDVELPKEILTNFDHAVKVRELLNERTDLSEKKKQEYLLTEVKKKILEDKIKNSPSTNLNTKEEKELAAVDIEQQMIANPDMGNKRFIEEMYNEELIPKSDRVLLENNETGKFEPNKVGEYLKFVAQQANGLTSYWQPAKGGKPKMENYPEQIIEAANERWKKEIEEAISKEESTPDLGFNPEAGEATSEGISKPIELSTKIPGDKDYTAPKGNEALSNEGGDLQKGNKLQWDVYGNEEMGEWTVGEKVKTKGGQDAVVLSKTYVESSKDGKEYSKEYADANGIKYHNESTVEHIVPISDLSIQSPSSSNTPKAEVVSADAPLVEKQKTVTDETANTEADKADQQGQQQSKKESQSVESITEDSEGAGPGTPPKEPGGTVAEGGNAGGITHAANEVRRKDRLLPEYEKSPQTFEQWNNDAEKAIKEGYDVEKLMDKIETGHDPDPIENAIRKIYIATLDAEIAKDPTDALLAKQKRFIEIGDLANSRAGRNLASLKGEGSPLSSISDFYVAKMEAAGVDKLTEQQKKETKEAFDNVQKADKNATAAMEAYREEIAKLKAENELLKQKKEAKPKKEKGDWQQQRKDAISGAREALKKIRTGEAGITVRLPVLNELIAIAPHVKKYVGALLGEGSANLKEVVTKAYQEFKDILEGITERDIHNIIAGEYNEPKPTRNELAAKMRDLKDEAYYINKLDRLLKGEEPKNEKSKISRNREITELRGKIKDIQSFEGDVMAHQKADIESKASAAKEIEKELTKAEKEIAKKEADEIKKKIKDEKDEQKKADLEAKLIEKELKYRSKEEIALDRIKSRNEKETSKIKDRIRTGDFETKKKVPFLEDPEMQRKFPKQYNAALDAIKEKEDARHEFDIALYRDQMARRTKTEIASDLLGKTAGTAKAIVTGIDDSAVAIQTYVSMLRRPRTGVTAFRLHILHAASQKKFNRWLSALHSASDFKLMKDAGLDVTEPQSLKEREKEEIFDKRFNGTVKIKGKEFQLIGAPLKPFERAFTTLGNVTRVVGFRTISAKYMRQGHTWENSPELFKSLARRLNEQTGRGKQNEYIENAAKFVTLGIWSPRLMSAKFNMLGISDVASLFLPGTKGYYRQLHPKERLAAIRDVAQFAVTVMAMTYGIALAAGGEVDDDPLSSTFMDVKMPNGKSYNFTGGVSGYIRSISQFFSGKRRKDGVTQSVNRLETAGRFFRGKVPPLTGAALNTAAGKNYMGEKTTLLEEAKNAIVPISIKGISQQIERDGAKSFFTQGIPTFFGFNVKDEKDYQRQQPKNLPKEITSDYERALKEGDENAKDYLPSKVGNKLNGEELSDKDKETLQKYYDEELEKRINAYIGDGKTIPEWGDYSLLVDDEGKEDKDEKKKALQSIYSAARDVANEKFISEEGNEKFAPKERKPMLTPTQVEKANKEMRESQ